MAKNEQPIFVRSPVLGRVAITTANALLDGTGAIGTVVAGGTDGVRIDQIEVKATATTTAGMVRLFLSLDAGATWSLWREVPVTAVVPSGSTESFSALIDLLAAGDTPLLLADTNMVLGASTEAAEPFNVIARGGSYAA